MRYILTFNECSLKCCNSDILFNQCLELRWRQSSQFSYIEQLWITSTDRFSRQFMNLGPDILPQYRQVKEYVYIYHGHVYISKSFNIAQLYKRELEVLLLLLLTVITWLARVLCNLYLCEEKILGISFHGFTATINIKVFWNFSPSVINISFVCIGYFLWKYASSRQLLRRSCQRQIQFQHSLKLFPQLHKRIINRPSFH